jgi:hypothetical protein
LGSPQVERLPSKTELPQHCGYSPAVRCAPLVYSAGQRGREAKLVDCSLVSIG